MDVKKELIWVPEEFAKQYNDIESEEEKLKVFKAFLETVSTKSKEEFRINLEGLQEDVAIYNGLMLQAKKAFSDALSEQLSGSYKLWEEVSKQIPSTREKIECLKDEIRPITEELKSIESLLKNISTFQLEKTVEVISSVSRLDQRNMEILLRLIENNEKIT